MSSKPIVLVTGLNGFIGSHVGDQFLTAGYNVRGTTRTLEKGQVIKKLLTEKHGEGRVEIVAVPNISSEGAFDQVVKGIHAVAHVASILSFDKDASKVIPATVAATTSILTSCLKEPTIKSFVLTSSSTAACRATANVKRTINSNSWNEDDVREAWKPESEWQEGHEWIVYGASKTEAEKALWNFRDEKKPAFTTNAVLPATVFGPVLLPEEASSTGAFVKMIYGGVILPLQGVLPQYCVDVRDAARLHVAAVKYPDVNGRRIFAWVETFNWNQVLKVLREIRPDHKFPDDVPDTGMDMSKLDNAEDQKLLVRIKGEGWTRFKEMLEASLTSFGY